MIIRRKHTKNFTILSKEVFADTRLSPEALGVLCYLRSLPDDWTVSQEHLRERFRCGKHKMQGIIRELIATGWLVRQTVRAAGRGTFSGSDYIVNDEPSATHPEAAPQLDFQPAAEAIPPQPDFPAPEEPEPAEPAPENRAAYQESNLTQDYSPLNPPTGGGRRARKLLRGNGVTAPVAPPTAANGAAAPALAGEAAERFGRLWAAFPEAGLGHSRRDQAEAMFAGMTAEEQTIAIAAAASYAAQLARSGLQAKGLHGWLQQRRFANFRPPAGSAPIGAASAAPARVFVEEGTPAWEAWMAYRRATNQGRCPVTEKAGHANPGWYFPSERPPAADGSAAA